MLKKKGEITSQQLVIIIILVISFAVILFFIWRLNLGETTEKEICHNSVVSRGSSALKDATPLSCHTEYICITQDGTCEGLTNPKIFKTANKPEVFKVLADQMYDCWWMFGEGKINYVGSDLLGELYCSICSQIYFDNSIKTIPDFKSGQLDKKEIYSFLTTEKFNQEQTYSEYLYGTNDLTEIKKSMQENHIEFGPINLDKQQYVMMGITSKVSKLTWFVAGVPAGIALGFIMPPVGIGLIYGTIVGTIGGTGGYFLGLIHEGKSGNEYLSPSIVEASSDEFNKFKCKSVETYA